MCLILMAWQVHPAFPVVIAANRDEFHRRPTAAAQWWPERPQLLAGRDLEAGGTWLGVRADGQVAALTNYRDPERIKPHAPSRGALVLQALDSSAPVGERLSQVQAVGAQYSGFNLICTDGRELGVYESVVDSRHMLAPGIYGLSNHLLDTPWPKVQRAKSQLSTALGTLPDETALLELLRDDRVPADHELPRTGVSLAWERLLSSAFIAAADYGTRSSTVIRIDTGGGVHFREWTWTPDGSLGGVVHFDFQSRPAN
jgi:uncharacterized protein with NRDE domain